MLISTTTIYGDVSHAHSNKSSQTCTLVVTVHLMWNGMLNMGVGRGEGSSCCSKMTALSLFGITNIYINACVNRT